jgi:hypothetical protein
MTSRWRASVPDAWLVLSVVTLGLAGVVALEIGGSVGQSASPPVAGSAGSASPLSVTARNEPADNQADQRVARILGRPIFTPSRRPEAPGAAGAAGGLARLSGVTVSPFGKSAIFAGGPGGKPIVIEEGARIGGYVVGTIEAGAVTVIGPDGLQVLHPSFDPNVVAKPGVVGSPVPLPAQAQTPAQAPGPPGKTPGRR